MRFLFIPDLKNFLAIFLLSSNLYPIINLKTTTNE